MLGAVPSAARGPLLPYVAAAAGGVLGALARWAAGEALPHHAGSWPWATLLVNLSGCLLLGVLIVTLFARRPGSAWLRPFLGTGVLGGYTTFSTFAVDTVGLADAGAAATAVAYVAASVLGGVTAAVAGVALGRAALPRPAPRPVGPAAGRDVA
jgi:fluoride exporter